MQIGGLINGWMSSGNNRKQMDHVASAKNKSNWTVYIILCSDNSLYTGISTDVQRRLKEHADQQGARGAKGAKYFRGRQPERLIYMERGHTRSSASRREAIIKSLPRSEKQKLAGSASNEIDLL